MNKIKKLDEMYGRYLNIDTIKNKVLNVKYGNASERNKLDIYYPDDYNPNKKYPTIVFFHGGAFIKGDKQRYQLLGALQGIYRGYAVVSANYRFVTTDPYPSYIEDAYAVSRFLKNQGEHYHLDIEKMAVWGESAGAVLAISVGFAPEDTVFDKKTVNEYVGKINFKAIIDWYGPHPNRKDIGIDFLNDNSFNENENLNVEFEIDKNSAALLIQHGTLDEYVSLDDSLLIQKEYLKNGESSKVELDIIDGFHHGVGEFCNDRNIDRIFSFLDKYVKSE